MKSTLKITLLAVGLLFAVGVSAQGPRGGKMTPQQRAEKMTQRMTEQLSLSKRQAAEIEKICLEHFKNMPQRPARGRKGGRPAGERPAPGDRCEHMAKMDSQIREVLSEEQYKKWIENRAAMRKKMQERRESQRLGNRPQAE